MTRSDEGTGQARIALSVALVEAALRLTEEEIAELPYEPLGSNFERYGYNGPEATLEAESESFRRLLDLVFRTEQPKKQLTAVFAGTPWQPDPDSAAGPVELTGESGEPVHLWAGIAPNP